MERERDLDLGQVGGGFHWGGSQDPSGFGCLDLYLVGHLGEDVGAVMGSCATRCGSGAIPGVYFMRRSCKP